MRWFNYVAGAFAVLLGAACLPGDLGRPDGGGFAGVPMDVLLILLGLCAIVVQYGHNTQRR